MGKAVWLAGFWIAESQSESRPDGRVPEDEGMRGQNSTLNAGLGRESGVCVGWPLTVAVRERAFPRERRSAQLVRGMMRYPGGGRLAYLFKVPMGASFGDGATHLGDGTAFGRVGGKASDGTCGGGTVTAQGMV